jgi:peroxiredoxin
VIYGIVDQRKETGEGIGMRSKKLLSAMCAIGLAVLIAAVFAQAGGLPRTGQKAPTFTLRNLNGGMVGLNAEIKTHKVTLVNFWGVWCHFCREEVPSLAAFYKEFGPKGVQILAVDFGDTKEKVKSYAAEQGINYPVLMDVKGTVNAMYGITGYPTTYILDRQGIVREIIIGGVTQKQLKDKVRPLLGGS